METVISSKAHQQCHELIYRPRQPLWHPMAAILIAQLNNLQDPLLSRPFRPFWMPSLYHYWPLWYWSPCDVAGGERAPLACASLKCFKPKSATPTFIIQKVLHFMQIANMCFNLPSFFSAAVQNVGKVNFHFQMRKWSCKKTKSGDIDQRLLCVSGTSAKIFLWYCES